MFSTRQYLWMACLGFTLVGHSLLSGCSDEVKNDPFACRNLYGFDYADIYVEKTEGGDTYVSVIPYHTILQPEQIGRGKEEILEYGCDRFAVEVKGSRTALRYSGAYPRFLGCGIVMPDVSVDDEVALYLAGTEEGVASVHLPEPFEITSPTSGSPVVYGDEMLIQWSPPAVGEPMYLDVHFIFDSYNTYEFINEKAEFGIKEDSGSFSIVYKSGNFSAKRCGQEGECSVMTSLTRFGAVGFFGRELQWKTDVQELDYHCGYVTNYQSRSVTSPLSP